MLNVKHKETVLRNADDKAYAIDVEVCMYKGPLTMKTVSLNTTEEGAPQNFELIDWDNSNKLGSQTVQWLIPTNKQTNTFPTAPRVENTAYDTLKWDWRELYYQDGDIIRVEQELREEHKTHDGYVTS
tara:strand:- start:62 stop:445 length:384 start_codon:yes stop_codon:yes gene_type:complete